MNYTIAGARAEMVADERRAANRHRFWIQRLRSCDQQTVQHWREGSPMKDCGAVVRAVRAQTMQMWRSGRPR